MTALAFATGIAAGLSIALIAQAVQAHKRNRDDKAISQHLAMVRALSAISSPRRDASR